MGLFWRPEYRFLDEKPRPNFCSPCRLNRIACDHTTTIENLDTDFAVYLRREEGFVAESLLSDVIGIRRGLNRHSRERLEPDGLPNARYPVVVDWPPRRARLFATRLGP